MWYNIIFRIQDVIWFIITKKAFCIRRHLFQIGSQTVPCTNAQKKVAAMLKGEQKKAGHNNKVKHGKKDQNQPFFLTSLFSSVSIISFSHSLLLNWCYIFEKLYTIQINIFLFQPNWVHPYYQYLFIRKITHGKRNC